MKQFNNFPEINNYETEKGFAKRPSEQVKRFY